MRSAGGELCLETFGSDGMGSLATSLGGGGGGGGVPFGVGAASDAECW